MSLDRRNFLHIVGSASALLPLTAALSSTGCAVEVYDVEIAIKANRSGSVLDVTIDEISGVRSDWNSYQANGHELKSKFIYSIRNMWCDWVFEINGNRINQSISECMVRAGDTITWKGNFA